MGAPKQKWTAEEEAALKAGVVKHGAGKWRTILMDPDFSGILHLRSNVDLKDKWRNINVTAIWGSRQKAKLALKRLPAPKIDNNHLVTTTVQHDEDVLDTQPLAVLGAALQSANSKEQKSRLSNRILEAIVHLKEPNGSDKVAIASYIEDNYQSQSKLRDILPTKLKHMVATGKIIKEKHKYRLAPSSRTYEKRRISSASNLDGRAKDFPEAEKCDDNICSKPKDFLGAGKCDDKIIRSKSQNDGEPSKAKGMRVQEVAAKAAKAVAEAEAATAEAERAARFADELEAEAEASEVIHQAIMKAFQSKTFRLW
ncbi:hypothetical protein TanjilG_22231 [Lupinus angustifolius]|uniref:MYB transcription factor n=1 Tax=Lupinus angustifolius TaxID=3871 RepID=A0A1J7FNB6_LUPAN|nr:PREDICTED: telomere repeat-binding factor 2-like [Lupinus angustifolius]XP_019434704.1 PREDICTED: telomere repeat-binding factor 2-like [Lupinus angustifolius]XP_019434705.1 PREDICTED: telomere repeat-binding factor 2-like [Lupinus angustifolius]XP_019434706.1 PREDICTED: telomere repeat-binding factor 2-like [Lupinus angustifolius]XP_019434707.1 PREDICTED: telomere repeat-binding factor 2-like [Lupinus angustifolius]XP_019434708.1 PREDICTED: telomere repeat-binding factor 2-like [Lupinus an